MTDSRPPAAPLPTTRAWDEAWRPLLIVLAVLAVYANSLAVPFVLDDQGSIEENPTIRSLSPPWGPLSPPSDSGTTVVGRPLLNLSFAVNYAISGLEVWSYHATNVVIHALAALALFGLVRRTLALAAGQGGPGAVSAANPRADRLALAIALVWAVHPLQTESVTYTVQRAESLVGLFYLFALYAFARSLEAGASPPGRGWQVLAVTACFLGAASKEVMATAPLALWLYDRTFGAGTFREAWRRRWRFHASAGASWLLLGWLVIQAGNRGGTAGAGAELDWWAYALTQCRAVILYLRLSLWPSPLVFDYGAGVVRDVSAVIVPGFLLLALLGATIVALRRWPRAGFVPAMFFLVLAPTSSVIPVVTQTMAEHRMYVPLAAVVTLVALGVDRWLKDRGWLAFAPLCVALAVGSVARNRVYQDEQRLWEDSVAKYPESARAQNNLGAILAAAGRTDEAIGHYREALRVRPDYLRPMANLAELLLRRGETGPALDLYANILRIRPDFEGHFAFGRLLSEAGRRAEAAEHFREAIRLKPDSGEAHTNLANLLVREGRTEEALPLYERARQLQPNEASAHGNLATALAATGRLREAVPLYLRAAELQPATRSRVGLALVLVQLGDPAAAVTQLQAALAADPGFTLARVTLGDVLAAQGRPEAAMHYEQALATNPNDPAVLAKLGSVLLATGRAPQALAPLSRAVQLLPGDPDLRLRLAQALRASGRGPEANLEEQRAAALRAAGRSGP